MMDSLYQALIIIIAIAFLLLLNQMGTVSAQNARVLMDQGAKIIDVRKAGEYNADHMRIAINVPLDELSSRIVVVAPDKSTPLLLHCLSGTRSGLALRKLKSMGYTRVANLGGIGRARKVLNLQ